MLIEYKAVKLPIVGHYATALRLIKAADDTRSGKKVAKRPTSCRVTCDGRNALVDKGKQSTLGTNVIHLRSRARSKDRSAGIGHSRANPEAPGHVRR